VRLAILLMAAGPRAALADLLHAIEGVLTPGMPPLRLLVPPLAGLVLGWHGLVLSHGWLHEAARVLSGGSRLAALLIPYAPSVLIGVPLLRAAAWGALEWWAWRRWLFGPGAVLALAPFVGIAGDYYEAGAILVTAPLPLSYGVLRFDDLFLLIEKLDSGQILVPGGRLVAGLVCTAGLLAGACLAGWTYLLGAAWHALIARSDRGPAPRGITQK
jgi:hypothetical protein